uniref:NADH:ubiquinone oxidoreductase subunit C2 n=1 Tax=Pelodiscus sinensis TaxID=13735 RepID=K7F922_PELSI
PPHIAGVHRQLLYTTVGWYLGYYLSKRADYNCAKRDRDLMEYIRHHPEDFKEKDKKTLAEVLEDFHPIR